MAANKKILKTMTGEISQLLRLYYKVSDREKFNAIFESMNCMVFTEDQERWAWLYTGEARNLKFDTTYETLKILDSPIVLGSFYSRNDQTYLDVGSINRALKAVTFFAKHIKKEIAELEFIGIQNRIISSSDEHPGICFDSIFNNIILDDVDKQSEIAIENLKASILAGSMEQFIKETNFILVEVFRARYYEDGIKLLENALKMREAIAIKRWSGHQTYSMGDLILEIT